MVEVCLKRTQYGFKVLSQQQEMIVTEYADLHDCSISEAVEELFKDHMDLLIVNIHDVDYKGLTILGAEKKKISFE